MVDNGNWHVRSVEYTRATTGRILEQMRMLRDLVFIFRGSVSLAIVAVDLHDGRIALVDLCTKSSKIRCRILDCQPMSRLLRFWRTTIGKKVVMAATGIVGIGFLVAHVAGNLLVFRGAAVFNGYSAFLHGPGAELLWPMRVVLLAALLLHVLCAYQLMRVSHAARPHAYLKRQPQVSTVASRFMRWGGAFLIVFIVVHLLHFTTGTLRPTGAFVHDDVYANLVGSFRLWWVALFYLVAVAFLGLHLYHGGWASARTLGATGNSSNPLHRSISALIALAVWFGFTLVPVAVMVGWVR